MKKLSLILVMLICVSFCTSAYEYDIQRVPVDENSYVKRVYDEIIIVENDGCLRMYDISGKLLNNTKFGHVFPYNYEKTIYNCYENAVFVAEEENLKRYEDTMLSAYYDEDIYKRLKTYYLLNSDRLEGYEEDINVTIFHACDVNGKFLYSYMNELPMDSECEKLYNELHKVMIKHEDGVGSSLWDNQGNRLTDYIYAEWAEDGLTPGFIRGYGNNKNWILNSSEGEWIEIYKFADGTNNYLVGVGVIEETENGGYIYYDNHLKQVTDIEFDEFLGVYNTSAVFKHDGKCYGFDTEWKLAYEGEKEIKAVYFGNYVIENENGLLGLYDKDFNVVISPEYENIFWICENVYVAEKDGRDYLYNQSCLVTDKYQFNYLRNTHTTKKMYNIVVDSETNEECVLDIEGNEIFRKKMVAT